jgi:ATP-dependent exoDNAse (exonuclease V) beta subunit
VVRDEHLASDPEGIAEQAEELLAVLAQTRESEEWKRVEAAGSRLVECPVVQFTSVDGKEQLVEGVADIALHDGDGWTVLDWKSDDVADDSWEARRAAYQRQVNAYAAMLADLTGERARGALVRVRPT